jgi:hypothetical protein
MRLSNTIVDAASRGDDIIAIASLLSSMFSSLDAINISKTSVEHALLPPRMEQALSAAWYVFENGKIVRNESNHRKSVE